MPCNLPCLCCPLWRASRWFCTAADSQLLAVGGDPHTEPPGQQGAWVGLGEQE